jgi:hypothetical protein
MFIFDAFKCVRNHNLEVPASWPVERAPPGTRLHERFTFTIHIHTSMFGTDGRRHGKREGDNLSNSARAHPGC